MTNISIVKGSCIHIGVGSVRYLFSSDGQLRASRRGTGNEGLTLFCVFTRKTLSFSVMDTLINVASSPEETLNLPRGGLTPSTTAVPVPDRIGVSLKNVLSSDFVLPRGFHWYALRVTYGRELEAEEVMHKLGYFTYVPKRKTLRLVHGKRKKVTESMVANLLFLLSDRREATALTSRPLKSLSRRKDKAPLELHFMYDHTSPDEFGRDTLVTVPHPQMVNFIRFTIEGDESIRNVTGEEVRFRPNEQVMITEGTFKGVVGRVARINRQTCVVVDLQQVCMLATAYIPKAFLRKIEGGM